MSAPTTRELAAEYHVLDTFDTWRSGAGHDYGSGQRGAELRRRRRVVPSTGPYLPFTADELAAAFERVGRPRLARAERDAARYANVAPTARRTIETWRRLERRFTPRPVTADELDGSPS